MGLSEWLLAWSAGRPRPVVVTAPRGTRVRLLAEAEILSRGWRDAESPAHASMLVVCGTPGHSLMEAVNRVWAQVPGPRVRVDLPLGVPEGRVSEALDEAVARLADGRAQRTEASERVEARGPAQEHERHAEEGHRGGHDGGHEHHMGAPGGLKMAERGPDRDGLALDRLHVPLGPVLPYWPAGLVVDTVMQGDVIQEASVRVLGGAGRDRFWDEPWLAALEGRHVTRGEAARRTAASHLDSLGRVLAVAGWARAAAEARRLRDRTLRGRPRGELTPAYASFARRIERSRVLRWMLEDLGVVGSPRTPRDVAARVHRWLGETGAALGQLDDDRPLAGEDGPRGRVSEHPSHALIEFLPGLLIGSELAAARLIVASLDPDTDQMESADEVAHA